jgi:hypothetical protein
MHWRSGWQCVSALLKANQKERDLSEDAAYKYLITH